MEEAKKQSQLESKKKIEAILDKEGEDGYSSCSKPKSLNASTMKKVIGNGTKDEDESKVLFQL